MKEIFKKLAGAALLSVVLYSCAPDDDSTPPPTPTDPKQKWIATWNCSETSKLYGTSAFTVHFVDSAGTSYVIIENLSNVGFQNKVSGSVSGSSLSIAAQPLGTTGFNVNGSGTMVNNNTINMNYYIDQGGGTIDTCSATLTK